MQEPQTDCQPRAGAGLSDSQLLERFVHDRDPAAFEALVIRHGPMVYSVCRRLSHHVHDCEDAFQATFFALVRKAELVSRREAVAGWLYRVAYRAALRLRMDQARRGRRERPGLDCLNLPADPQTARNELRIELDEAVNQLPERYRVPIVLCYFEGLTRDEAARQLGCPPGTIASRLAWAKDKLRERLTGSQVASVSASLATLFAGEVARVEPPGYLVNAVVNGAVPFQMGIAVAAGVVPGKVAALTEGVLRAMLWTKVKVAIMAVLVAIALTGVGAFAFLQASKPSDGEGQGEGIAAVEGADEKVAEQEADKPPENESPAAIRTAKEYSVSHFRQLAIAMHVYNDRHKRLPPPVVTSKDGKPLYSWRVLLLPYLQEEALYKKFHLDEPWDSEHNIKLLPRMPRVYAPFRMATKDRYSTFVKLVLPKPSPRPNEGARAFSGIGTPPLRSLDIFSIPASFPDGTSNCLLIVEAANAIPWTKPGDVDYDAAKPVPNLGARFKDGFCAAFADGSAYFVKNSIKESTLRALITRDDGINVPRRDMRLESPGASDNAAGTSDVSDRSVVNEDANSASVKSNPPVVVKTIPQAGDTAVDATTTTEIRVTFSKDMADRSWSWVQISKETFPELTGKPSYDKDKRTCILPVKLAPGKTYVLWLNSPKFQNFRDADGRPAVSYPLVFETKP